MVACVLAACGSSVFVGCEASLDQASEDSVNDSGTSMEQLSQSDAGLGSGEFATSHRELIWSPGETWVPFLDVRNSATLSSARHSLYSLGVGRLEFEDCTGFLISRDLFVTAHHCTEGASSVDVQFLPGNPFDEVETNRQMRRLGFWSGSYTTAATATALGEWNCNRLSRESGMDIEYYVCPAVSFTAKSGYTVSLHPGDIFGHLDVTTNALVNNTAVEGLSVNQRFSTSDPDEVLVSPNGKRTVSSTYDVCWIPPGQSYAGCLTTQGEDMLPGSSGGATLRRDDSLVWGVLNGFFSINGGTPGRTVHYTSGASAPNRHRWSPLTANTLSNQYYPRVSDLPNVSSTSLTVSAGGSGGSPATLECDDDEAIVGVIGSQYNDPWTGTGSEPLVLGNFGIVCGPGRDSAGHFLQSDHLYVRTLGSYDTDFADSINPSPTRYNRYRNTALASMRTGFTNEEQTSFICPAGYALLSLKVRVKYGKIRRIEDIRCRHMFDSTQVDLTYGSVTGFGTTEASTTSTTMTCPTGEFGFGVNVRTGWFTDQLQLICRDL